MNLHFLFDLEVMIELITLIILLIILRNIMKRDKLLLEAVTQLREGMKGLSETQTKLHQKLDKIQSGMK